jgi:hypothetical protein
MGYSLLTNDQQGKMKSPSAGMVFTSVLPSECVNSLQNSSNTGFDPRSLNIVGGVNKDSMLSEDL